MNRNNILELENPSKDVTIPDTLTDFLRESAQKMLKVAIESEVRGAPGMLINYKVQVLNGGWYSQPLGKSKGVHREVESEGSLIPK